MCEPKLHPSLLCMRIYSKLRSSFTVICVPCNINESLGHLLAALFVERIVRDVDLTHGFEDSPRLPVDLPIRLNYRPELTVVTIDTISTAGKT